MEKYKWACFKCGEAFLDREVAVKADGGGKVCPLCEKSLVVASVLKPKDWSRLFRLPAEAESIESNCPICHEAVSIEKNLLREELECPHCDCKIIVYGPKHSLRVPRTKESYNRPLTMKEKLTPAQGTPLQALVTLLGTLAVFSPVLALPPLIAGGGLSAIAYVMESSPYSRTFVGMRNGARVYEKKKRTVNPETRRQVAKDAFWTGAKIGTAFSLLVGIVGGVKFTREAFPDFDCLTVCLSTGLAAFTGFIFGWFNGKTHRFPNLPDGTTLGTIGLGLGMIAGIVIVLNFSTREAWIPNSQKNTK